MDVGLPRAVQEEIRATHQLSVEREGRWQRADGNGLAYAGSNASEYFAELTMWYFGSRRLTGRPNARPGRSAAWLT